MFPLLQFYFATHRMRYKYYQEINLFYSWISHDYLIKFSYSFYLYAQFLWPALSFLSFGLGRGRGGGCRAKVWHQTRNKHPCSVELCSWRFSTIRAIVSTFLSSTPRSSFFFLSLFLFLWCVPLTATSSKWWCFLPTFLQAVRHGTHFLEETD